ncbi:MAG: hypothetical protein WC551_10950 [Patescibacteria group bacterium]
MANTKPIGVAYSDPELDAPVLGASGGTVGFYGTTPVAQGAALTAQLTAITIADAAGTPDYALQALTTTSPYGLATLAEAVTVLYVIQNLQARLAQVEARLETIGLIASN